MNRALKFLFALTMLTSLAAMNACNNCTTGNTNCGSCSTTSCDSCCDDCTYLGQCDGYPFLQARSQGRNSARQMAGVSEFINKYGMDSAYGMFSIATEYSQSFQNERLSHFLFGSDMVDCCNLYIQGSDIASRNPKAWLADYFGLPTDYNSKISFCPKIQNAVVDLDLYVGLDGWTEGLYMRFNAPIVWTKWQLCPSECQVAPGTEPFIAGYMSSSTIERTDLPKTFLQAMTGCSTFGDMKSPIKYGRFNTCDCTEAGVAELDFTLGWNFHLEEDHSLGLFAYVAAPTGTRPCATNIFEPIVGNGKHWELGGGIQGDWIFWRSEEHDSRYMGLWLDATIATQFKASQCRSFDFKCKPNSRYMLLEEMQDATAGTLTGEPTLYTASTYQYKNNLIPAINWSTFQVDVSIPVYGDIALKLGAVRENWNFDLGYNLWARTGEKFCNDCCSTCNTSAQYAIKGSSNLYGRWNTTNNAQPTFAGNTTVALGQTQSAATIHGPALVNGVETADSLQNAYYNAAHNVVYSLISSTTRQTSIQPVLVTKSMLNMGRSPSSITNKIFSNIGYAWKDREGSWTPFLGIGGEVEFSLDNYNDCCCCDCNSCDSCNNSCAPCTTTAANCATNCNSSCGSCGDCGCSSPKGAVSIWGVWVKGGVAFD